jgi:phosphomannomutase
MIDDPDLMSQVERWLAVDPDEETRSELRALVEGGALDELRDRFAGRLQFGTAGLRGAVGPGPNRMNRVVVRQAATGLMRYLGTGVTVVIGYDARPTSAVFAADTAAIVAAHGGHAILTDRQLPTPVIAHGVRHRTADAGVVVTASHNPRPDNGYKVYLADGAQLISPHDRTIEAEIEAAGLPARELPAPAEGGGVEHWGWEDALGAYLDTVAAELPAFSGEAFPIAYTPLHGVGRDSLLALFARLGMPEPAVVAEQGDPDGAFPTVPKPNPEEDGALDLVIALAREIGAELVLANDPDADRLAVTVFHDGGYRALTGDELGLLLADHVMSRTTGADRVVVNSIVSSRWLERLAHVRGVQHAATLTGFKWLVRPGLDGSGRRIVFAYEEALGYSVCPEIRDKDGLTAAAEIVAMVAELRARGVTLVDRLDELADEAGLHMTAQRTLVLEGAGARDRLTGLMTSLRGSLPSEIAGIQVAGSVDYLEGAELAPADMVQLDLADGSRVILRPSGTEPKIKAYLEVVPADRTAGARALTGLAGGVEDLLDQLA